MDETAGGRSSRVCLGEGLGAVSKKVYDRVLVC